MTTTILAKAIKLVYIAYDLKAVAIKKDYKIF